MAITIMPWGPYRGATLDRLPSAYILSLIAPMRLRLALAPTLEAAMNAEWARRRKEELRAREEEFQARKRAA